MKKIFSVLLSAVMLLSVWSCFAVSAATEKYPPLETGAHIKKSVLEKYSYETVDEESKPISLEESFAIQVDTDSRIIELGNDALESQIKNDFVKYSGDKVTNEEIGVDFFGTLSDGSLLVFIKGPFSYATEPNYRVIGKYVYITSCGGNDIKIYRNNSFTSIIDAYQNGSLSDELLDETAEILCFAKFVNPNEEPETPVLYGDVDNDGVITVLDATLVQKLGLGIEEPESELISVLADVNNDGRISITDVTCIQKYIAGGYGNTGRTGIVPLVVG